MQHNSEINDGLWMQRIYESIKKRLFETTKSHYGRGSGSNPVEVLNFSGFPAQPLELRSQL